MKVTIAGATGRTGRLVTERLVEKQHTAIGLARSERSARELSALGARTRSYNIATASIKDAAAALEGSDVAVFAAGAAGYTEEEFRAIDRDGLITFADGAREAGVQRIVVLSSMSAGQPWRLPAEGYYMKMKGEGDDYIIDRSQLRWQILRPGFLVSGKPTGLISASPQEEPRDITRADVADVILTLIENEQAMARVAFEVINGATPIRQALGL